MRCKLINNASTNADASGVYIGELDIQRKPSDRTFNELFSNDEWKFRSPYWKVTEPKSKKSSQSVPGVPTYGVLSGRSRREQRRFSPPSKSEFLFQHPTILEVSGSYENYPSNSSQNESLLLTKEENVNGHRDSKRNRVYIKIIMWIPIIENNKKKVNFCCLYKNFCF